MNQRFLSVLIFAFIVAVGASLLLYRLLARGMEGKPALSTAQVLLAGRNLEIGTLIKDPDLKTGTWSGPPPAGALNKREDIVGRGVIAAIFANEPLLESRLAPRGAGAGLASMIPPGMRAVAVRVNEVVGVGGFVVPGMRVDVLISGNPPGTNSQGSLTKTLLQNIEVLSAGQDFRKDAEGKPVTVPVVNLLVTPEQAEKLSLAAAQTVIQLVLRNPLDNQVAKTPGTGVANLFGGQPAPPVHPPAPRPKPQVRAVSSPAPPPPQVKPPPPFIVETIHGGKKAQTKFAEGNP